MPAYHSKMAGQEGDLDEACGCTILPLKTQTRGPAPIQADSEGEDIIDEVIKYFRPNSLFRNFEVKGGAARRLPGNGGVASGTSRGGGRASLVRAVTSSRRSQARTGRSST